MLAGAELGRAEIRWLLAEMPCKAEKGVPGGAQQLRDQRGSPGPHESGRAHGGLSSRQGAAEPAARTATGAGLCSTGGSSCPSQATEGIPGYEGSAGCTQTRSW